MYKSENFNASVHGLRGFAALSVVLFHIWKGAVEGSFLPDYMPSLLKAFMLSLSSGVELFFMISGYLISFSVMNHKSVREFIINRAIRIYPAFLPVFLIIFVLGPFAGYDYFDGVSFAQWAGLFFANLFFLPGVIPMDAALIVAWTLSYEAFFYVFCATAAVIYRKYPNARTSLSIAICAFVICIAYPQALFFLIGAGIYFFKAKLLPAKDFVAKAALVWFLLFLASSVTLSAFIEDLSAYGPLAVPAVYVLLYTSAWLTFSGIALQAGQLAKVMASGFFQFLGSISYSLYLWHTPIMFATKRLSVKLVPETMGDSAVFLTFALSSLLIAIPVAWVSYIIFEEYAPKLLKKKIALQAQPRLASL